MNRFSLLSLVVGVLFCLTTQAAPSILDQLQEAANLDQLLIKKLKSTPSPQIFVRNESFDWKSPKNPEEVIYGNEDIGFFSSKNFRIQKGKIELTLIPPTYLKPVQFLAVDQGKKRTLGSRKFSNPLKGLIHPFATSVMNRPTFPFVMLNGTSSAIPFAINRLGEVVWLRYIETSADSDEGSDNFKTTAIDILPKGDFLFLRQDELTHLVLTDSFGKTKYDIDFKKKNLNLPSSHTVEYLPDSNEILYLSYDCRELPRTKEFIPLFKDPAGWLKLLTLPRRTYRGGKLVRLSLDTLKVTEVWNSYQNFSPNKNPSLAAGFMTDTDAFMDVRTDEEYKKFLDYKNPFAFVGFNNDYCNVDWTHENSAQYIKGKGYLVSIRNLNKVIFLKENGQLDWTLGSEKTDTYRLNDRDAFSLQHSAVFLPNNRIALYDNHTSYRGFKGLRLGNRILNIRLDRTGEIQPEWSFSLPSAHSDVRGSTSQLPNGNFFAYTAGNPGSSCQIFEVDPKTSRIVGDIRYNFYRGNKGFEAKPFFGFGGDVYLGARDSAIKIPAPANPPKAEDFLQFSY